MDHVVVTTVLIVDDNHRLAEVLRSLIDEEPDFAVVPVATTAAAAVQSLRADPIDVIIVDDRLTDTDHLAVVERLHRARPEARILLWSSDHLPVVETAGIDGLLAKGETFQVLIRELRRVVREPQRRASRSSGQNR